MSVATVTAGRRAVGWITAFAALSWMGEVVHNRVELPQLTLLSPENSMMVLVAVALVALWWAMPSKTAPSLLLLGLALLHLIGGAILTVLPLPFLPFTPEQSVSHYLAHLFYGIAQLPLIVALVWQMRQQP